MALGSFGGGLGFGLAFILEDQFSDTAGKIEQSMGGLSSTADKTADNVMGKFSKMAGLLGVGFSLGASIQAAAQLSDQLVTVADVTGMTSGEIESLRGQLEGMDTRTSLPELLDLATLGSQLGVAQNQLGSFAQTADAVGLVLADDFGGSATEAVKKLNQLGQVFNDTKNLTPEETIKRMGSAVDALGDSAAINTTNVTMFAQKLGELGDLGPTATEALGLGAALDELGVKTKGAASQFGAILTRMAESPKSMGMFAQQMGLSTKAFRELFDSNPNEAVLQLAESFKKQGLSSSEMVKRMKILGIASPEAAKLLSVLGDNADKVREKQELASAAFADGTGVLGEASARNQTLAAQLEKVQRNFQILLTRIGEALAVGFGPLIDIVNMVIKAFSMFAASPFGKAVIRYTGLIVGFAAATVLVVKGIKAVGGAFSMLKKQAISTLIAFGPYALVVAPIIAIGMAVYKAVTAFQEFDGTVKSGFGGFFQRLGGIIQGIREIWMSWDSVNKTFEISGETMNKLNQLGIGQLVVNIGTWVVRIYEFLSGVMTGFYEAFSFVWGIISWFFEQVSAGFEWLGIPIGKNTAAIEQFGAAGQIVGYILVAVLGAIAVAAGIAAINMIIAFFPVILVIAAIAAGIYVLVNLWEWFIWVLEGAWNFLSTMWEWGANLINYIWEGIKSAWRSFTNWIWEKVTSVPLVGPAIKWLFGDGEADPSDEFTNAAEGKADSPEVMKAQEEMSKSGESTGIMEGGIANKFAAIREGMSGEKNITVQPSTTIIELDGREVGRATTEYQSNELSKY